MTTPQCKYGHGDMIQVTSAAGNRWALISADRGSSLIFSLLVHVCPTCGYIELFDDNLQATVTESRS